MIAAIALDSYNRFLDRWACETQPISASPIGF
jgi:hypothetical protein